MTHDKAARIVGTAVFTAVLGAGWALLIASSGQAAINTYREAEKVPSLHETVSRLKETQTPSDYVAVPLPLAQARLWRKLPSLSELEADMLVVAVYEEAGNQSKAGMQAVASAILNRTGTKHGLTVAEVIRAPKQFSFVNQTAIGNIIGRNSQEAIRAEAKKPKYDAVRKALVAMVDTKTGNYSDYAAGTDYYYNPAASSAGGRAWFAKNTVPVMRIGAHVFCRLRG